jgi:hypothetical protein
VISTPQLIEILAECAKPVRPLRPPLVRTGLWLMLAAAVFVLLGLSRGMRPDLAQQLAQPVFVVGIVASLATGVLAALASFLVSLPDRSRAWILLPLPTLVIWVSTMSYGCFTNWVSIEPNSIHLGEAASCFATLMLTSLPLSISLFVMLRFAAWFRPTTVTLTGSLAVAAVTASALSLFHAFDATIMILVWNLGVAATIVGVGALLGLRARALI